jgi:hypothetical protein
VSTLTAATWVFALLLAVAGAHKIARPATTGTALALARLTLNARLVWLLGAAEIALGLGVLLQGGRLPAALLAVAYAGFAGVAEHQRRKGAGCGCFGVATTAATTLHVALDVVAALVAGAAATQPGTALPALVTSSPLVGLLSAALLAVAAGLLRLLLTAAPDLTAAVALVQRQSDT